jgi:hypothetical protein
MKETIMLKGLTPPEKEYICAFMRNATDLLSKEDLNILNDNLADLRWTHAALATALTERGLKCYDDQVRLHRNGRCACVGQS